MTLARPRLVTLLTTMLAGWLSGMGATAPGPALIQPVDPLAAPPLWVRRPSDGVDFRVELFDSSGAIRPDSLMQLREIWAVRTDGAQHPVHWRLATVLVAVASHYPDRALEIVSGFRHPEGTTSQRSRHTQGRAIDLRVPGVSNWELFNLLRASFDGVGLGYYPNSSFIHLDVRARETIWIDYAGPGQRACYSPSPHSDIRSGAVHRLSDMQARQRGCK